MVDIGKLAEKMTERELLELLDLKQRQHMDLAREHEALAQHYSTLIAEFGGHAKAPARKQTAQKKRRPGRPKGSGNKKKAAAKPQTT